MTIETNGKTITLNLSQEEALFELEKFFKAEDKLWFCLSGSAGTGKTTICKEALKNEFGICVTAPTHKAKKVISKLTGYTGKTIHSLLGLAPDMSLEKFNHKNLLFAMNGSGSMEDYRTVVVDEASMLNVDLVKLIKCKSAEFRIKVIFMGDSNQLPPVKEKLSSIFTDPEIVHFTLTQVERQHVGNPLINLYNNILTDINSSHDLYSKESDFKEGLGYKFQSSPKEFTDNLEKFFQIGEYSDNKIICWTNEKVRKWNNLIRSRILPRENLANLNVGEFLTGYRTVRDVVNPKRNVIENACEYKVLEVSPASRKDKEWDDQGKEKLDVTFYGYDVRVENLDTDEVEKIFVLDKTSYDKFAKIAISKSNFADSKPPGKERSQAWARYYGFRNLYFLVGNIVDDRGNELVEKDLDYYYTITVHKCQGSTFENVFVDESNLDEFYDPKMTQKEIDATRNRLKYVAFSRPSKGAFIYHRKKS